MRLRANRAKVARIGRSASSRTSWGTRRRARRSTSSGWSSVRCGSGLRIDDRHVRNPEPHLADDHPDDVLRLARRRVPQEVREEADLPILATFARFARNRIEVLVDLRGGEGSRCERFLPSRGDRLLGDDAKIAFLLPET